MNSSKLFSPLRTWDIATSTFQQLMRMKVFYFVVVFAVLFMAGNFIESPFNEGPESEDVYVLNQVKSYALGGMSFFAMLLAIVCTALLLPRDVEDRTLFTILAKPVPRLDYLTGKFLGVVLLIFTAIMLMDVMTVVVLEYRTSLEVSRVQEMGKRIGKSELEISAAIDSVKAYAPDWQLQATILAIFLKSVVLCALALLLSTFATSTLFTIIISLLIFFIGHFTGDIRDFMLRNQAEGISTWDRIWSGGVLLIVPDLRIYDLSDAAISGVKITGALMLKLTGIAAMYSAIYIIISWFIFADKEL